MTIRTILIDDRSALRSGIRSVLELETDIEVVGEGASGHDAIRLVEELAPTVVVMDVAMAGMGGIEATYRLRLNGSSSVVVALSMHRESSYVKKMFEAGASGYVLKDCAAEELVPAIRAVLAGNTFLGSGLAPLSG